MALPLTGVVGDLCVGTLFINYKNYGWSERFILANPTGSSNPTPTLTEGSVILAAGANYRANCLAGGHTIVWGRVSLMSNLRDSLPAISAPIAAKLVHPESTAETTNNPGTGFLVRFDDGAGKFCLRMIRGVRDSWIVDTRDLPDTFSWDPGDGAPYVTVGEGATYVTKEGALANWLLWIKKNTVLARKTGTGLTAYTTYALPQSTFRGVRTRDTGRPFGTSRGRRPAFA